MKNDPVMAPLENALVTRFMQHVENDISVDHRFNDRLDALYLKFDEILSKEQMEVFEEFNKLCEEYDAHRLKVFYKAGFSDGFASGAVIAHEPS